MAEKAWYQKLWKLLTSKQLSIVLLTALTIVVTVQVLILTKSWNSNAPQAGSLAGRIYSSWWFTIISGALLLNLAACTANNLYRRIRLGVRNWQLWGSTIFHAGLTIILLATLITGSYRIFCSIKLVEGEAKEIPYQALLTYRTTGFDASDRFQIILQDQQTKLTKTGMEPQIYSTIKITAPDFPSVQTSLTDSAQLPYRDIYFLPNQYGYAVKLAVEDTTGKVLARKTIPLDTVEYPNGQKGFQKQEVSLDPFPEHLNLSFMPNLDHPQLSISFQGVGVTALGGNGLTQSFSPGQHLDFGGYRLTFEQVKPWTELLTGYDPGAKLFFVGIALAMAGQSIVWLNKFKGEMA